MDHARQGPHVSVEAKQNWRVLDNDKDNSTATDENFQYQQPLTHAPDTPRSGSSGSPHPYRNRFQPSSPAPSLPAPAVPQQQIPTTPLRQRDDNSQQQHQYHTSPNAPQDYKSVPSAKKSIKYCKTCGERLTGQFVRALGDVYHVSCFCCYACGKECASKFFSSEVIDQKTGKEIKIALCEQDYFKKLDLVCFKCQNALRGPYVTALNRKYHLEHFTCSICSKIFEKDESFYEHESEIYCHLHYSKLYASHCEGCHAPILKQYAEIFRGGRIQQWHPECFMVHKFWSITVTAEYAGLDSNMSRLITRDGALQKFSDTEVTASDLFEAEQKMEQAIMAIWLTFSAYEEATAACISNMLQYASTGQQLKGLLTTGKLILMVEKLFNGINSLHALGVENLTVTDSKYQNLKKEPRSLSAKIMTYLAILRKASNIGGRSPAQHSKELLSLITGLAHYLKLIIRYGLYHALQYNKFSHSSLALEKFSREVRAHEKIPDDVFPTLNVPATSTDSCSVCKKSIEQECVAFHTWRWHLECLQCVSCQKAFSKSSILDAAIIPSTQAVYCAECSPNDAERGFVNVSRLTQLVYLLKIALVRSRVIMERDLNSGQSGQSRQQQTAPQQQQSLQLPVSQTEGDNSHATELRYKQTLTDIKRMRSTRRDQKLSSAAKQTARRSRIIETPDAHQAEESDLLLDDRDDIVLARNLSFLHSNVEDQMEGKEKRLIVEDEPQLQKDAVYFDRTTDLLKNQKSLTLDDIPRIVSAEEAREQRPNAFKHATHSNTTIDPKPRSMKSAARSNTVGDADVSNNSFNNQTTDSATAEDVVREKAIYYSELNQGQHFILRHIAILCLLKTDPKHTRDDLLALIPTKKATTFWGRIFKSSDSVPTSSSTSSSRKSSHSSSQASGAVFGLPLEELTIRYGVESDLGVGPAKLKIPAFMDDCISAMHQMDMSVEGVFRKNGNIKGLRTLTEQIDNNPTNLPDFTKETPIQLAALLKKFLRELPDPLLTFKLYDLWISSQKHSDPAVKYRILKICNCMLPTAHRDFAEVLLFFLRWVTSFAYIDKDTGSKMHTHNLATVITPNILYTNPTSSSNKPPSLSNADAIPGGEAYLLAIEVLDTLLQTPEDFATVPAYLMQFYEQAGFSDQDQTTKEIMLKCDTFLKQNPSFFEKAFEKDANQIFLENDSSALGAIRE